MTDLRTRLAELEARLEAAIHCGRDEVLDVARDALALCREFAARLEELEDQHRCYDPHCGRICPKCRVVHHPDTKLPESMPGSRFSLPKCPECGELVYWLCALRAKERDHALARVAEVERERDDWKKVVQDMSDEFECSLACQEQPKHANGHTDDCPVTNAVAAFTDLRRRYDTLQAEVLRLRGALEGDEKFSALAALKFVRTVMLAERWEAPARTLDEKGRAWDRVNAAIKFAEKALDTPSATLDALRDVVTAAREVYDRFGDDEGCEERWERLDAALARLTALVPGLARREEPADG